MRKSRLFVALTGAVAVFSAAATASASHSWGNYHWARSTNPAALEVVDSLVGEWDSYLGPAVTDWNASGVIELTTTPGADSLLDRTVCLPIRGKIRVCNAKYADARWLGLATVWTSDGHIVQATAQVNDTWFDTELYNDPNAKRHVLCQEVGHDFGLGHTYTEPTCMDDRNGLFDPAFVSPGPHDYQQLDAIYAHLDGTGGPGPKPDDGMKGGSTIRVWQEGDMTVVQYVFLAPAAR